MSERIFFQSRSGLGVTQSHIEQSLVGSGLLAGDVVMVHSRLFTIGRVPTDIEKNQVSESLLAAIRRVIGAEGTIVIPTFTFSVCSGGYFDKRETPSEMGALSEYVRLLSPEARTSHPFYSAVILGPNAALFEGLDHSTCFGDGSIFHRLHELNTAGDTRGRVKFLTIGIDCPPEGLSVIHSIEERLSVPYRYHKVFRGVVNEEGELTPYEVDFFVRDRSAGVEFDGESCWELLKNDPAVRSHPLGDSMVSTIPESVLVDVLTNAITLQPGFLCRGGYRPIDARNAKAFGATSR